MEQRYVIELKLHRHHRALILEHYFLNVFSWSAGINIDDAILLSSLIDDHFRPHKLLMLRLELGILEARL